MGKKLKKRRVLITGASGFVGAYLLDDLIQKGSYNLCGTYYQSPLSGEERIIKTLDIRHLEAVLSFQEFQPEWIIHSAALTGIDACEENKNLAYEVNVQGSEHIADLANRCDSKLLYLSTDVVFNGRMGGYTELDHPSSLHFYGQTKWMGEERCLKLCKNTLVARINVIGSKGFAASILQALGEGKVYNAFSDVLFCPLKIEVLAQYLLQLIDSDAKGIYHVVGSDVMTKYAFAQRLARKNGFSPEMIQKGSVRDLGMERENNLSLSNQKLLKFLKIDRTPILF